MSSPATSHSPLATATQSSDDVLVRVEGVSKKFCRSLKKSLWYGVCDIAAELNPFGKVRPETGNLKPEKGADLPPQASGLSFQVSNGASNEDLRPGEFYAVRDVSFELRRGECLGLIGRNGAGKTTLLKMLNGLIKPDAGRIEMQGRIGALIALGAGFNPILTGRENIYVNGSVLGLSKKEIDGKMDGIIDFAEIREFIDSPVQSYSSGMQVRLGFAVATAMEPDVLILDEVLAVGDISFRVKCYNCIRDILPNAAVIFVSHSMWDVSKICSQVLAMDKGARSFLGCTHEGIVAYNSLNARKSSHAEGLMADKDSCVSSFRVMNLRAESTHNESTVHISLETTAIKNCGEVRFRLVFFDSSDTPVAEWDSMDRSEHYYLKYGINRYMLSLDSIRLISGNYRIALVITDLNDRGYFLRIDQGLNVTLATKFVAGMPYRI